MRDGDVVIELLPTGGADDAERRIFSPKGEMAQVLNRAREPFHHLVYWDLDSPRTGAERGHHLHARKTDRLYVATTDVPSPLLPRDIPRASTPVRSPLPTTTVHAFALDGRRTSYVASGSFRGQVKDRWSFSEYAGHLRVAVQRPRSADRPQRPNCLRPHPEIS